MFVSSRYRQLFTLLLLVGSGLLLAQSDVYVNQVFGTPLDASSQLIVEDEKYGVFKDASAAQDILGVENRLLWTLYPDSLGQLSEGTYTLLIEIFKWDDRTASGQEPNGGELREMVVRVDTASYQQPRAIHVFKDARKFSVKVRSLSFAGKPLGSDSGVNMQLVGEVIVNREKCVFTPVLDDPEVTFISRLENGTNVAGQEIAVVNLIDCATEYDLEYTFYDEDSEEGRYLANNTVNVGVGSIAVDELFRNNSTRLTLRDGTNEFRLFGLFRDGLVLVRYRGAAYTPEGLRLHTNWSSSGTPVRNYGAFVISVDHQTERNWQATTAFAEDAKQLPSVTYQDGTQRPRQTMTLQYEDVNGSPNPKKEYAISQRALYDAMGRPAASVLPTPIYKEGSSEPRLNFDPGILDIEYNTFPYDLYDKTELERQDEIPAFSRFWGTGNYYSRSNNTSFPELRERNAFVPDAEGYPLSITRFTADNTGRIRRQGNVGKAFQPGRGHDSRYFYGKPLQPELDRLFGTNVGNAEHYEKTAVIDPNGQTYVAYLDSKGRTVATALSGPPGAELAALPSYEDAIANATVQEADLLNNIGFDTLTTSHTLIVTSGGNHSVCYTLAEADYCLNCPLDEEEGKLECYECKYDIEVSITQTDDCVAPISFTIRESDLTAYGNEADCFAGTADLNNKTLVAGEYIITKKVWVSATNVDAAIADYEANSACITTEESFVETYLELTDLSGCSTCDCSLPRGEWSPECLNICEDAVSPCSALRTVMLQDVSPGGQYAVVSSQRPSIFAVYPGSQLPYYQTLAYAGYEVEIDGDVVSPNELAPGDFIDNWQSAWAEQLLEFHPEYCLLTWCEGNINEPRGPDNLSSYVFDTELQKMDTWAEGKNFSGIPTLQYNLTEDQNYENIESLVSRDPLTVSASDESTFLDFLTGDYGDMDENNILAIINTYAVSTMQWPETNGSWNFEAAPTWQKDLAWRMFRDMYIGKKRIQAERWQRMACEGKPSPYHDLGWECLRQSICEELECPNPPTCNGNRNVYRNFTARVTFISSAEIFSGEYTGLTVAEINDMAAAAVATNQADCAQRCSGYTAAWTAELTNCDLTGGDVGAAVDVLFEICLTGCAAGRPYGSSTVPEGADPVIYAGQSYTSFSEVLSGPLLSLDECSATETCNPYVFNYPPPAERDVYAGALTLTPTTLPFWLTSNYANLSFQLDALRTNCACSTCPTPASPPSSSSFSPNVYESIAYYNGMDVNDVRRTVDALVAFVNASDAAGTIDIPTSVLDLGTLVIPAEFDGSGKYCVYREVIEDIIADLPTGCNASDGLIANRINSQLGWNRSAEEYRQFLNGDFAKTCLICADPLQILPPAEEEVFSCEEELIAQATVDAESAYERYYDLTLAAFGNRYREHCLTAIQEDLRLRYTPVEYHYTLYYYDQAGNLTMTVPPAGVAMNTNGVDLDAVENWREQLVDSRHPSETDGTPETVDFGPRPAYGMLTHYAYNTFGATTVTDNPDSRPVYSWYDRFGRVFASQDGRQAEAADPLYSYTKYDVLGRVIESGESTTFAQFDRLAFADYVEGNLASFTPLSIEDVAATTRYRTLTYYTDREPHAGVPGDLLNLPTGFAFNPITSRNRVTSTLQTGATDAANDNYASHYTYDIAGNVDTLIQDFPQLEARGHRFKLLDYDYDLISGNVNYLFYQKGQADQFTYYYEYDKTNRLSAAYSSSIETDHSSTMAWRRDAAYTYYDYGPLRRTVIGQDNLQGMDYAYTLQGWIKMMNGSHGLKTRFYKDALMDINGDGYGTSYGSISQITNRDLYRYGIAYTDYRNKDYRPVAIREAANGQPNNIMPTWHNGSYFNGNIAGLFQTTQSDGYASTRFEGNYDQLYRIVKGRRYHYYQEDPEDVTETSQRNQFNFGYRYDGNGNLQWLERNLIRWHTANGQRRYTYNSLDYHYQPGSNLLTHVTPDRTISNLDEELIPYQRITDDILFNYDDSGNLRTQNDRNPAPTTFSTVEWTPYGKVNSVANASSVYENLVLKHNYGYGPDQNRWVKSFSVSLGSGNEVQQNTEYQVRDASGNTIATYFDGHLLERQDNGSYEYGYFGYSPFRWRQQYLYGSSRLGQVQMEKVIWAGSTTPNANFGARLYELSDHLGNVTTVFSENVLTHREIDNSGASPDTTFYQAPQLVSYTDYSPFGLNIARVNDQELETEYRFGFNGKERDDNGEWGDLTHYDYGARIYNPAIGRWLSVDPLANKFAGHSPYNYVLGNPIGLVDPDGRAPCPPGTPGCNGWNTFTKKVESSKQRIKEFFYDIGSMLLGTSAEAATYTDANDVAVLATAIGGDARNIDGSDAGAFDVVMAAAGLFLPYASGSAVGKGLKQIPLDGKFADQVLSPAASNRAMDISLENNLISNGGEKLDGTYSFVITSGGELKIGADVQGAHFELADGANSVMGAGKLKINKGEIYGVNNNSGHYNGGNTVGHTDNVVDVLYSSGVISERAFQSGANVAEDFN